MLARVQSLRRYGPVVRAVLIVLAAGCGIYWFFAAVHRHYPVQHWLVWTYAKLWGVSALFALSCLAGGRLVLQLAGFATMRLRERLVMGFAVGVLLFFVLMFVGGLAGLYGKVFALALPAVLLAAGFGYRGNELIALYRRLRRLRSRPSAFARSGAWWQLPALAFGVVGVLLVYLPILSPRNVAFDSLFYHLGIAQQYATQGGIYATPEGWTPAALPHLSSVLYTWSFLVPGLAPIERVLAAAHLEFVIFLATLASVPSLVRWLVPGAGKHAWVAVFLFPGIFVYDSNLSAAADHINAFWAIPIFLALRRAIRGFDKRDSALLAAMLAAAALTKYQAMYLLAFPLLAYVLCALWSLVKAFRRGRKPALMTALVRVSASVGVAVGVGLLLTSAHWLKNWAFYGDPLFPYLHRYFPSDQWVPNRGELLAGWEHWQMRKWTPHGPLSERLKQTFDALSQFSVEPHDWRKFHGKWPVFGSLFTLCTAPLLFVRRSRRTWAVALACYMGIAIWFWTMHQDRYLQALVPWMACVVAATTVLVWRTHWLARPAMAALIAAQLAWGGDAPAIPSHAMSKTPPLRIALDMLGAGYKKNYDKRWTLSQSFIDLSGDPTLPAGAKLLLHEQNPRLGLWRPVVADVAGWQYGLRYDLLENPKALHDKLVSFGVTHIVTRNATSRSIDSVGADLHYFHYIKRYAKRLRRFGGWTLYQLPERPPPPTRYGKVLYLGCSKVYEQGLHETTALSIREQQVTKRPPRVKALEPAKGADLDALLEKAQFVATEQKCMAKLSPIALSGFETIATRQKREKLWVRR